MKDNKWAHVQSFAQQVLANAKNDKKDISLRDVAQLAKGYYDLDLTVEQVYQIIYRGLPKDQEEDKLSYLSTLASRIGTKEEKQLSWIRPEELYGIAEPFEQVKKTPPPVHSNVYQTPGTYLVLGCSHAPAHNVPLFEAVKGLVSDIKNDIAGIVWLGDTVDCNTLSHYDRGRFTAIPGMTLDEEYKIASTLVSSFNSLLPKQAHRIFMYGNHEDRYNRYMADMENAKRPLKSPEEAMNLVNMGYHMYRKWQHDFITLGNHLDLMHGQYFSTHCAKKHIDNYRGSVMFAHTHRIQMYIEGSVGGFNIGWMGDPNSPAFDYMPRGTKKQWQNGFALVNIDEQGEYYVNQIIAHNNKFYFNGKKYA